MESEIINALSWRYATKLFDTSKKVSENDLNEILEAIRLAPSSFGLQPWKFIVIENQELREKIAEKAWNQPQITESSHLIILCARTDIREQDIKEFIYSIAETRNISPDSLKEYEEMMVGFRKRHDNETILEWCKKQTYIALGILLTSVALKKIDSSPMEGFDPKGIDEILGLKEQRLTASVLCAIGYRSHNDKSAMHTKVRYSKEKIIEKR